MKSYYILIHISFILFTVCVHVSSITTPSSNEDNISKHFENGRSSYNGQHCFINVYPNIFNSKDSELLKYIYDNIVNLTSLKEQNISNFDLLRNKSQNQCNKESVDVLTSVENLSKTIEVIQNDIKYIKNLIEFNANIKEVSNITRSNKLKEDFNIKSNYPVDCFDLYFSKGIRHSGVYTIQPLFEPFEVYCDMETDGGGWIIIQNRFNGSVNFYRNWANYTDGFGILDKESEFWLGLEKIHQITYNWESKLRIDLEDFNGNLAYAIYSDFHIGNKKEFYKLHSLGEYQGSAGNSLQHHLNNKFSTYDNDHDNSTSNCAKIYTGAWWYKACHTCNLNGQYLTEKVTENLQYKGMTWNGFIDGSKASLKKTRIMLRRRI